MQVCLFFIARRIAGERAGVIAAAIPALTATLFYGAQGRPYGVLLGLSALVLWSWQGAMRRKPADRGGYLVTLAIALALALNTHYFAVLLLIPLCAAELFRMALIFRRTHDLDWQVSAAIAVGALGVGFTLPFQRAAGEFRLHYYNIGNVSLRAVTQSYRALFVNYTTYRMPVQRLAAVVLVLLTILLLRALWRQRKSMATGSPAERVFLVVLAAMPVFGFLLARFVTHTIEVRYVLSAIVGLAVLIAIAVAPWLRSNRRYAVAVALLLLIGSSAGVQRVREERARRDTLLRSLTIPPRLRERLLADPGARLYEQNLGAFDETTPYYPDAEIRRRTVLLYSRAQELAWLHHDTVSLTAMHMQHLTGVPVARYEDLQQQPGTHLILLHHGGWEWMAKALEHDGAEMTDLGPALGGEAFAVRFPGHASASAK